MHGIQLFFVPGGQTEITVSPQALRHFRGEQAGNDFVTLLALFAHASLNDGQAYSTVTPIQIAAETGLRLGDVQSSLQELTQQGWFELATLPDGRHGYHIHLNSIPGETP